MTTQTKKRMVSSNATVEFKPRWQKVKEESDGTLYYRDPESGQVYMETRKGWIPA